jgi:hypothetical protein
MRLRDDRAEKPFFPDAVCRCCRVAIPWDELNCSVSETDPPNHVRQIRMKFIAAHVAPLMRDE